MALLKRYCALTCFEHVDDFVKVLGQLHRISKPGGIIFITVPFWNSTTAWADPQHKRGFTLDTFTYFRKSQNVKDGRGYYQNFYFKVLRQRLTGTIIGRAFPEFIRRKLAVFFCNIGEGIEAVLRVEK